MKDHSSSKPKEEKPLSQRFREMPRSKSRDGEILITHYKHLPKKMKDYFERQKKDKD